MSDYDRARIASIFDYNLYGEILHRTMGPIEDLGIFLIQNLILNVILTVVNRTNKIFGFIRRYCADINDTLVLKSIYTV